MTETSATATAFTAPAFVGNGRAVHIALGDHRGLLYTRCGAEGRSYRQSRLTRTDAAVTCENCTGEKITAAALPTEAPATCAKHKQAAYAPKTVKAGTYVGYPCGCKVWTA